MSAIDISMPPGEAHPEIGTRRLWTTLFILAFGAFVIGTSEFLIMGTVSSLDSLDAFFGQRVSSDNLTSVRRKSGCKLHGIGQRK